MKKLVVLLVVFVFSSIQAGDYGTIKGKVVESSTNTPLIGANISILNTNLGASTDVNGFYKIENVPIGKYKCRANYIGYEPKLVANIQVKKKKVTELNFTLNIAEMELEDLMVISDKPLLYKSSTSAIRIASSYTENYNTEEYSKINESGFFNVIAKPLSTFAADIDGASYSNARRFLMNDQLPYKDAIRTEEFINYFDYDYKQPKNDDPLSINLEYSDCPWNENHNLVHIGLKGKELSKEDQKPSNLVFLLDVSGSMSSPNKLPLLKKSF